MPRTMAPDACIRRRAAGGERERVEEGRDQAELLVGWTVRVADDVEVGIEAIDRLGQHRVAEAIDRVRELGDDRRVDRGVVADRARGTRRSAAGPCGRTPRTRGAGTASRCRTCAAWNRRSPSHCSASICRLAWSGKRAGAVPGISHWLRKARSLLWRTTCLGLIDQAVVLGMEDGVDGGEADVLVHAAVAGDVVRVEQLVVVGARPAGGRPRVDGGVAVSDADHRETGTALCAMSIRNW